MEEIKNKLIVRIIIATTIGIAFVLLLLNYLRPADSFMIRMSGYFAAEEQSKLPIVFTCLFERGRIFQPEDVVHVSFEGMSENVRTTSFGIKRGGNINGYRKYSVDINLEFLEKGKYASNFLVLVLSDGSKIRYPIGDWFFDIDEKEVVPAIIDTWQSPAVTSDGGNFAYDYRFNRGYSAARIRSLQVSKINTFDANTEIETSGKIPLTDNAPVKYIRSKIIIEHNGVYSVAYGKGNYCGAMNLDTAQLKEMQKHIGVRIRD